MISGAGHPHLPAPGGERGFYDFAAICYGASILHTYCCRAVGTASAEWGDRHDQQIGTYSWYSIAGPGAHANERRTSQRAVARASSRPHHRRCHYRCGRCRSLSSPPPSPLALLPHHAPLCLSSGLPDRSLRPPALQPPAGQAVLAPKCMPLKRYATSSSRIADYRRTRQNPRPRSSVISRQFGPAESAVT